MNTKISYIFKSSILFKTFDLTLDKFDLSETDLNKKYCLSYIKKTK